MATWTNPTTFTAGQPLSLAAYNAVANNETFLYQAPYAAYFDNTGTACAADTLTLVTLSGTTASGYGFSVSSNKVVLPLTGIYTVSFSVAFPNNTGGYMWGLIQQNGTTIIQSTRASIIPSGGSNPNNTVCSGSGIIKGTANDQIGLYARQTSFVSLTTTASASQTFIHLTFVGSQ
jgi:hypothetical protein